MHFWYKLIIASFYKKDGSVDISDFFDRVIAARCDNPK